MHSVPSKTKKVSSGLGWKCQSYGSVIAEPGAGHLAGQRLHEAPDRR